MDAERCCCCAWRKKGARNEATDVCDCGDTTARESTFSRGGMIGLVDYVVCAFMSSLLLVGVAKLNEVYKSRARHILTPACQGLVSQMCRCTTRHVSISQGTMYMHMYCKR